MLKPTRREFLQSTLAGLTAATAWTPLGTSLGMAAPAKKNAQMRYGLVTYLWGADWDLPTLISNCEAAGIPGVELRTTHGHGVERTMTPIERKLVKQRFANSGVINVGIGSNERYDNPDPKVVQKAIEATKDFIRLSQDVGGSGVKVKPDRFYKDVPREKTIEQIGNALNLLGKYGLEFNQQIRLEVHGQCAELPTIRKILDVADHPNVAICWNCNPQDLQGAGLEKNFRMVADRFGDTCHIHQLEDKAYPYEDLFRLLQDVKYTGWMLLEAGKPPKDRVAGLKMQLRLFNEMLAKTAPKKTS